MIFQTLQIFSVLKIADTLDVTSFVPCQQHGKKTSESFLLLNFNTNNRVKFHHVTKSQHFINKYKLKFGPKLGKPSLSESIKSFFLFLAY